MCKNASPECLEEAQQYQNCLVEIRVCCDSTIEPGLWALCFSFVDFSEASPFVKVSY